MCKPGRKSRYGTLFAVPTVAKALFPVHLTLLVPELLWPEPADRLTYGKLAAPGLATLLGRARRELLPRRAFESCLASCFDWPQAPLGAMRRLGEGNDDARDGHWLAADPVHLRFHHERIILADAGAFDLEQDEADALIAALNAEFADIGHFHASNARHWYLRLHAPLDHTAEPLSAMAGRRLDSDLADKTSPLHRWLNEAQMFLHGHPINERRQAAGKPAINSLWLWGGGTLDVTPEPAFTSLFSDNPLASGLGCAAGILTQPLPASLDALPKEAGERPLIILDALLPRVLYEDGDGWRKALEKLDADWFLPLKKSLGKRVDRSILLAPTIYGEMHLTLTAGDRWKFWKAPLAPSELARQLADLPAQP